MAAEKKASLTLPLDVSVLRTRINLDPERIQEASIPAAHFIGRERAKEALETAIKIPQEGFNVYALGSTGTGKHELIFQFLKAKAKQLTTPPDWCYVHNFENEKRPVAVRLPAGAAPKFAKAMEDFVDELKSTLPAILANTEFRERREKLEEEFKERETIGFTELAKHAEAEGVAILNTSGGFVTAPAKNGGVMTPEEFGKLSEDEQKRHNARIDAISKDLKRFLESGTSLRKERREKEKELLGEFTLRATGALIEEIKKEFKNVNAVVKFLDAVAKDVVLHSADFQKATTDVRSARDEALARSPFGRYRVNVFVTSPAEAGAPFVYEDNPTFANLTGKIEHEAVFGALITDFCLMRPGALHKANGGFLVLDARLLLTQPYAWEGLKRRLLSKKIVIESLEYQLGVIATVSLEPEPIPLDLKIVIVGDRELYYLLAGHDPDFEKLFKIAADFDDTLPRASDADMLYLGYLSNIIRSYNLLAFSAGALALAMEESVRLSGDVDKFSLHKRTIENLLIEASHYATMANASEVARAHVDAAIESALKRRARVKELVYERIEKGVMQIATKGEQVGQVNALTILQLGDHIFGQPTKVTARVRYGREGVLDIQRETKLGGSIHSKGVFILSAYVQGAFAVNEPLSLSASLVLEQTYGLIDGDSASVAELCALLSALSEVPIDQSLAITGAVNQMGDVQAIGGVNEKIEGFFDVCSLTGLSGKQGVLIPHSNVRNLMLREDVVKACEEGKFKVYAVRTVNEAIALLTHKPTKSVVDRVERRLLKYAKKKVS